MRKLLFTILPLLVLTTALSWVNQSGQAVGQVETGLASYYCDSLAGRKTASGELYQPHLLTAAHKSMPFGTLVKVTCRETTRSVMVKINDRGPFIKYRIIDLSKSAFQAINLLDRGVIAVDIEVIQGTTTDLNKH